MEFYREGIQKTNVELRKWIKWRGNLRGSFQMDQRIVRLGFSKDLFTAMLDFAGCSDFWRYPEAIWWGQGFRNEMHRKSLLFPPPVLSVADVFVHCIAFLLLYCSFQECSHKMRFWVWREMFGILVVNGVLFAVREIQSKYVYSLPSRWVTKERFHFAKGSRPSWSIPWVNKAQFVTVADKRVGRECFLFNTSNQKWMIPLCRIWSPPL